MATHGTLVIYNQTTPKLVQYSFHEPAPFCPKQYERKFLSNKNSLYHIKLFQICRFQNLYLHITQLRQPLLLKFITPVSFPCLKRLYLQNLKINNFEPLQWIECPNLTDLFLKGNSAISLKSLAKTKFNILSRLELDSGVNHSELNKFSRMKLDVRIQLNIKPQTNVQSEIMAVQPTSLIEFMFKTESENLRFKETKNIRRLETIRSKVMERNKKRG